MIHHHPPLTRITETIRCSQNNNTTLKGEARMESPAEQRSHGSKRNVKDGGDHSNLTHVG